MNDKEREDAFPVHIELGEKDGDRMSYPVVDFGDAKGLDKLPDEGCALVHFKRAEDGSLEVHRICLAKDDEDEYDEPKDLASALGNKAEMESDEDDEEDE